MSISNRHPVNLFVAGKSAAMSEQRLARVGYKSSAKNPAKYPNVCASVPRLSELTNEQIEALQDHIFTMLETAQDGIFRSLYESSDGKLECITDDDISVESCIAFLNAEAEGSRITKEMVEKWFVENVQDNLTVVIAEKLGFDLSTPEQESTVQKHINGYKALMSALSGGKTILTDMQIKGLQRALEVSSVDDEIASKLSKRLVAMQNKPKIEDLLDL